MMETIVSIIGMGLVGVVGWAVHLNSRVAVLEADKVSLKELINLQLLDITRRLARIEAKLDHEQEAQEA